MICHLNRCAVYENGGEGVRFPQFFGRSNCVKCYSPHWFLVASHLFAAVLCDFKYNSLVFLEIVDIVFLYKKVRMVEATSLSHCMQPQKIASVLPCKISQLKCWCDNFHTHWIHWNFTRLEHPVVAT